MSNWTAQDYVLAQQAVDVVATYPETILGQLQLARAMGMPTGEPARNKRILSRVMTLAVELSVAQFPGMVLLVERDGTDHVYKLTDDPEARRRTAKTRLRRAITILTRAANESPDIMLRVEATHMAERLKHLTQ